MQHLPHHPDPTDADRASWAATERRTQEAREAERRRGLPRVDRWQKTLCTDLRNARLRDMALAAPWGFCWRATVVDGVDADQTELGVIEAVATAGEASAVVHVVTAWDIEDDPEAFQRQIFSLHGACEDVALAMVDGIVADI